MDIRKPLKVEDKSGVEDKIEMVKKEPWFEDKLPGDGKAENSFPTLYNSTSWENELESSKNKSWFDLVEEDEADIEKSSLNHDDSSVREQGISDNSVEPQAIKVKDEIVHEEEHEGFGQHYEMTTSDLPVKSDIKQEKDLDIAKEKCIGISSKQDSVIVEKQKKTFERTKPQQTLEDKSIKQERQLESVPMKRERNSTNTEMLNSKCQRGKRIKQEIVFERLSDEENKHDCTDEKFNTQFTDECDKAHTKVKDELKYSNNGDGGEFGTRNRKRTLDVSVESVNVKRERNASSSSSSNNSVTQKKEYERDPEILSRRQKQIDYGKNTIGYDHYRQQVPKEMRTIRHPRTPPKHIKYSRRGWDGMIRVWRQQLHGWDPASEMGNLHDSVSDTSVDVASVTSDDNVSDCLQSDHPSKLDSSTPSSSIVDLDNVDYLTQSNEKLDSPLD